MNESALLELHARVCHTLANPRRLQLLSALREGEHTVGELTEITALPQSTVSRHLAIMRAVGVVTARRDGQQVYYRISSPHVLQAYDHMHTFALEYLSTHASLLQSVQDG